jgi:hypothetical protein
LPNLILKRNGGVISSNPHTFFAEQRSKISYAIRADSTKDIDMQKVYDEDSVGIDNKPASTILIVRRLYEAIIMCATD